ncbi:ABC transporter permease [Nibricoccus sp. IMCC34717]|uniref:ABC transporter permease n=1 Tax=Nibricoccus sp. IMCC34717 TaxID=3034021 RepID=UPI00384EC49C
MNWQNIFAVYFKELRDSLRDRRTLISTLVVPTFAMPLIMGLVAFVAVAAIKKTKAELPTVVLVGAAQSPQVRDALSSDPHLRVVPFREDWQQAIANKSLRAAVEIPDDFDQAVVEGRPVAVNIRHYEGEMASGFAVSELTRFFDQRRQAVIAERLQARGIPGNVITPFQVDVSNVAPPEKVGGNILGGFLPYLALMLCFSGAMYPAMDLTAGEKERGTLETILSSPVSRTELVLGKFLLVLTAALATVLCSLTSMAASLSLLTARMASANPAAAQAGPVNFASLHLGGVVGCFALLFPTALLASAALMAIAINARTMKEAQSYLAPLLILVVVPSMLSLLPGIELNAKLALVPLLNVSLVSKQMVSGIFHWDLIALVFFSCFAYAALALAWCVRRFNSESVLFRT